MCDSPRTGCARRITPVYMCREQAINRVIMACELYCCSLPQCEALRTCRSGFPIATAALNIQHSHPATITLREISGPRNSRILTYKNFGDPAVKHAAWEETYIVLGNVTSRFQPVALSYRSTAAIIMWIAGFHAALPQPLFERFCFGTSRRL